MSAQSVSGVGQGSADKAGQKGSEHLFVGVNKLVGPRVTNAGFGATTNSVAWVSFPALSGVSTDYAILVSGSGMTGTVATASAVITGGARAQVIPNSQTGTLATSSVTVTSLSNTGSLSVGMGVIGANVPTATTVASIVSATSITLSNAAVGSGATALIFGLSGTYPLTGFEVFTDTPALNFDWAVIRVNNATVQVN